MGDHCEQTMRRLNTYIDRELSESEVSKVKAHLDDCPPCEQVFDFQAEMKPLVRKECCTDDAPARLRDWVPQYVAYMGAAATGTETALRQQLKVLGNAALFVGGFATAFVALGASFGLIGADLKAYRPLLLQIAGAALVLIGIALLTLGRIPGLMSERRFDIAHRLPRAPWASYVIGLAFAIGWTPCVGPTLAAILLRARSSRTAAP